MRKLAWIGGVLIALLVVVYFSYLPLLRAYLTPGTVFDPSAAPPAPNYAELSAWVAHPALESAAKLPVPGGSASEPPSGVAVFYAHPTTYWGPNGWNADPAQAGNAHQGIEHMVATHASVFNGCCEVYAPHYRQAHIAAFGLRETDAGTRALDLAYTDLERAFEQFLQLIGPDTPFFIAGHSQGTAHMQRLLSNHISGGPLRERLVAAYLIGYWLPQDLMPRNFPDVPFCENATATGCVITYDAYRSDGTGPGETGLPQWYRDGWEWGDGKPLVCINPLNWQPGGAAEAEANLGALPMLKAGGLMDAILDRDPGVRYASLGPLLPAHTGARCDERNLLRVAPQVDNPFDDEGTGEDGMMHRYDWNLFYMNIRQNVAERSSAYAQKNGPVEAGP